MKYLWDIIREEDEARERKYLEDIGVIGRLFDNELTFPFVLLGLCGVGFVIGFMIGMIL